MARIAAVFALVLLTASLARAVDITVCGQTIASGEVGTLAADLTCPTSGNSPAVLVNQNGILMLNGHTLDGGGIGVYCAGPSCRIYGPGEIVGSGSDGVLQLPQRSKLKMRDVVIRDHVGNGILVYSIGRVLLENVTITGNLNGVRADGARVKGTNLVVSDNGGNGMVVGRYRFKGLTLQNNGVAAGGAPGFASPARGRFVDSTLTGNGQPGGVDIALPTAPSFIRSTCERSGVWPLGGAIPGDADPSLGICTLD